MTLIQLLSPNFPIGAFAYSHGLEWAIETELIQTGQSLQSWLTDLVELGSARTDAVILARTILGDNAQDLNELALSLCASSERITELQNQGAAFCKTLSDVWEIKLENFTLPVAVGLAARTHRLDVAMVLPAYLHAFCSNLISTAIRTIPLGQSQGQRILLNLHQSISKISKQAEVSKTEDITSCCFLSDVASMKHNRLEPRIFKT